MTGRTRQEEIEKDLLWDSEPRTLHKHAIYRRYVQCWMGKILGRFDAAAVVDGFAGPGVYRDGVVGSPQVLARANREHSARSRFNTMDLYAVEFRQDRRDHLERLLSPYADEKLRIHVPPASAFADVQAEVCVEAHAASRGTPVLWILDPFKYGLLPLELVDACLAGGPKDEVLVTWFTNDVYRNAHHEPKWPAIDRLFGHDRWHACMAGRNESQVKDALHELYLQGFKDRGLYTGHFEISARNTSAHYAIVYVTHSTHGMQCWNQAAWSRDRIGGRKTSESAIEGQIDMWGEDLTRLEDALRTKAGLSLNFAGLLATTHRLGFKETHLRTVLTTLGDEGLAVRESPLDATSPWPDDSIVRFYTAAEDLGDEETGN